MTLPKGTNIIREPAQVGQISLALENNKDLCNEVRSLLFELEVKLVLITSETRKECDSSPSVPTAVPQMSPMAYAILYNNDTLEESITIIRWLLANIEI